MKSSSTKKISLSKLFPNDGKDWRITWISSHIQKLNDKQPEFTVHISQLISHGNNIKLDPLLSKNLSNTHKQFNAHIGYQNLLYIGSVWRNGENVSGDYHYNKECIEIDTSKAQTISFDQIDEEGYRILKFSLSGLAFKNAKNSTIIALPYNGDPYGLLIPASEVIRFYYLISSIISCAIYYGLFDVLTIGKPSYDPMSRKVNFTLNHGVSKKNAPLIARYHSSEFMRDRVKEIHSWVKLNSIKNHDAKSTYTFFPFHGNSKLEFHGVKLKSDNGKERFFCTKILSCSGPTYFRRAHCIQLVGEQKAFNPDDGQLQELSGLWPLFHDETEDTIDPDEDPSTRHATKSFTAKEVRFTSMRKEQFEFSTETYDTEKSITIVKTYDEDLKQINTGKGTYGDSNTRKAEIQIDTLPEGFNDNIPLRLKMLFNALDHLKSKEIWLVNSIKVTLPELYKTTKSRKKVTIYKIGEYYLNGLFKTAQTKNSWVQINLGKYKKDRGIFIAEIKYSNNTFYLFDLESDPGSSKDTVHGSSILLTQTKGGKALSNEQLYEFMKICSDKKGWPSSIVNFGLGVKQKRLKHLGNLEERLQEKMLKMIDS